MTSTDDNESEPEMAETALPERVKDQPAVREEMERLCAHLAADIAWMASARHDSR